MLKTLSHAGCALVLAGLIGALPAQTAAAQEPASCGLPHGDAAVMYAAPPEYPTIADLHGDLGTAIVKVDLLANGAIAKAAIAKSSGNYFVDRAALKATHESTFRPETKDCAPISGSYLFVVSFDR